MALHSLLTKCVSDTSSLVNCRLSIHFFSNKNDFPRKKQLDQLPPIQLHKCFSSRVSHYTSIHLENDLCKFLILSHKILRRHILKHQDLIKLIIFIDTSRTILSETEFLIFFQWVYGNEKCNDANTFWGHALFWVNLQGFPPLLLHCQWHCHIERKAQRKDNMVS